MEEVLLHVGMHKTGTSSLQATLAGYDDGDTVYAQLGQSANHSVPVYTAFSSQPGAYHHWRALGLGPSQVEDRRRGFLNRLDALLARPDRRRLILSGEDISILDPQGKTALIGFLRDRVPRLDVVCYLRSPGGYALSAFQQRIRGGGIAALPPVCDPLYRLRTEGFRDDPRVSRLRVREFARDKLKGHDIVEDFAALTGLDTARMTRRTRNEGMSAAATKLVYCFNRTMPLRDGDRVLQAARLALGAEIAAAYPGPGLEAARVACLAEHAETPWLRDAFAIDFTAALQDAAPPREALEAHMADLSGIPMAPLDALLAEKAISGRFPAPADKLLRLYLWHVGKTQERTERQARRAEATPSPG
ncbi:hypothetical protein [Mangrovicoccus algicola]|uniref:Uncharacterized protein n=1 Tax=Mangrovicoccus algicola TaxID=2771008 RepID=A0A8J6YWE7_9RHOB|nr:hypothetical protein [Mangrovicoccus algicola]MBE3639130.1 hypothetical protein [Mangrovicoccus algicola]